MSDRPRDTPRWRRRARRGVMIAVPLALLAGLWWQREALLQQAAGRTLGAEVTLSGLRLIDGPALDYLGLRDPTAGSAPMLLSAEGLRLHWAEGGLRAERKFDRLEIERLRLMAANAPASNYGFFTDLLNAPASGFDPLPYLARRVAVDELVLALETAGASLSLEGVAAEVDVAALDDLELRLLGEGVRADWLVDGLTRERQSTSGSMTANLTLRSEAAELRGSVALPGLLEATVTGTASTGNDWSASLTLPAGKLEGPVWSRMLSDSIGYPVDFDSLELAEGSLQFGSAGDSSALRTVALRMNTGLLVVGPPDAPQYAGPAALSIEGDQGTALAGRATLTLDGAPDLSFELSPGDAGLQVRLAESDWSRAQLAQILPPAYRDYLDYWPALAGLRIEEAAWQSSRNFLNATGSARTADAAALRLSLEAGLGAGEKEIALTAGGDDLGMAVLTLGQAGATLSLENTPLDRWLGSILGYSDLALPGVLTGSLKQGIPGDDGKKPLNVEAKLELPESAQGNVQLTADLAADGSRIEALSGKLALPDAMTLNLRGGKTALSPFSFNLPLRGNVDLAALGRVMNLEWPAGDLEFSGAVANHADGYRLRGGEASLAALTLGDIALPEEPFRIKGDIEWRKEGALSAPAMDVAWSDTFTAQAKGLRWTSASAWGMDELKASGTYGLLTAMGVFDTADTTFEVSATDLGAGEAGFRGQVQGSLQGGFVLPDALLAAVNLKLSLQGELGGEGAAGPLEAQELAAFGVTLRDTTARARLDWPEVFLDDIATRLFDGMARGSMRVDLAGENYPVVVDATLENIYLAAFTREFKPPDTELTGLVSGSIHAAIAGESITELDVKLVSGEGFTLNRAMVAQILMQQQVGDITGSGTVSKIVERVIGSEDARPFTGAELNLGIVDGRIAGQALLKSKSLNLTVDIKADQKALFEAMRMRQEGQVAGIKTTLN